MRHRLLLICLVLSGFAGLAYELLWTRLLSFSFGSTTLSFSTVLAVFFGGLALGAYLAGQRTATVARPIRTYAIIEILTGASGLLLHPLLSHMSGIFTAIDPGPGLLGALVRFAVSAPILLAPTLLMGATLPLICAATIEKDDQVGSGTALIYGVNTFGACLGAYLVTYHLLPTLGVFGSNLTAVFANLAAGAGALFIESRAAGSGGPGTRHEARQAARTALPSERKLVIVASVLTGVGGFAAIALQIVWVRLFSTFLLGTIYGVGAVLISVLVGISVGAIFIARELRRSRQPVVWLVGLQLATILSVIAFARSAPWVSFQLHMLASGPAQGLTALHTQLAATFAVLAVPTICSGASFPLLVHLVEHRAENTGRAVGSLYAANTVGSILGSVLGGFVILPHAGSEAALLVALVSLAGIAALAVMLLPNELPRVGRLLVAAAAVALPMAYQGIEVRKLGLSFPPGVTTFAAYDETQESRLKQIAYFAEGEHATVVVSASETRRGLALSGLGQGTRSVLPPHHVVESLLVGVVPLAHARSTERALVVGLGAGQTVEVLAELGVDKVKVVELEARVIDAVKVIFEPKDLFDPAHVEVSINDARHELLLEKSRGGGGYDLITSMPAHPWVAASIFTEEFFELARANLAPGGIFCTWFGAWRMDAMSVESLLRAFTNVFPSYIVYWVEDAGAYYLVGGVEPLKLDLDRLAKLGREPLLAEQTTFSNPYWLPSHVYASGSPETPRPPAGIENTDDTALVETHAPRSSTRSPVLDDFMPVEYLHPSFIPTDAQAEFYDGLLETLLGTPNGRLLDEAPQLRLARARRTLEGVGQVLSPDAREYFAGRIALAEGKGGLARTKLEALAKAGGPYAARAEKFAALSHPKNSAEQIAALAALPKATDVAVRILAVDRDQALARSPDGPLDPAQDPLGWFLATAKATAPSDAAEVRSNFRKHVGPRLRRTQNLGLLALCEEVARRLGLAQEATTCHDDLRRMEIARSKELVRAGTRAGAQGNFAEAARLLAEAERLAPGDTEVMTLLLRALVEVGDEPAIEELCGRLRFQGNAESWIEHTLGEARARKLGQDVIESASQPESPTMGPESFAPKE